MKESSLDSGPIYLHSHLLGCIYIRLCGIRYHRDYLHTDGIQFEDTLVQELGLYIISKGGKEELVKWYNPLTLKSNNRASAAGGISSAS